MPRRQPPIPDFLQEIFQMGARVGAKALASAVSSALEDVGLAAKEVDRRVSTANRKLRKRFVEPETKKKKSKDFDEEE